MTNMTLQAVRQLIANDSYAITFQSVEQYRGALLRHFDSLVEAPIAAPAEEQHATFEAWHHRHFRVAAHRAQAKHGGNQPGLEYWSDYTNNSWAGWQAALAAQSQGAQAVLRPLSAGLPDPGEHVRVLVYTEGVDFAGDQYFDILTEDLWEPDPDMREEIADAATHWMPLPMPGATISAKAEAPAAEELVHALRQAERLLRAAGFAMTGTASSQIVAAIAAHSAAAQQATAPGALLAILRDVHDTLVSQADSDIDHFEDDDEEREGAPVQYAARKVMEVMDMLKAAASAPGTPEARKGGA